MTIAIMKKWRDERDDNSNEMALMIVIPACDNNGDNHGDVDDDDAW